MATGPINTNPFKTDCRYNGELHRANYIESNSPYWDLFKCADCGKVIEKRRHR